jgi:hypothetical protein
VIHVVVPTLPVDDRTIQLMNEVVALVSRCLLCIPFPKRLLDRCRCRSKLGVYVTNQTDWEHDIERSMKMLFHVRSIYIKYYKLSGIQNSPVELIIWDTQRNIFMLLPQNRRQKLVVLGHPTCRRNSCRRTSILGLWWSRGSVVANSGQSCVLKKKPKNLYRSCSEDSVK